MQRFRLQCYIFKYIIQTWIWMKIHKPFTSKLINIQKKIGDGNISNISFEIWKWIFEILVRGRCQIVIIIPSSNKIIPKCWDSNFNTWQNLPTCSRYKNITHERNVVLIICSPATCEVSFYWWESSREGYLVLKSRVIELW